MITAHAEDAAQGISSLGMQMLIQIVNHYFVHAGRLLHKL